MCIIQLRVTMVRVFTSRQQGAALGARYRRELSALGGSGATSGAPDTMLHGTSKTVRVVGVGSVAIEITVIN